MDILEFSIPVSLSHHPENDSSLWFRDDVQWIIDKVFKEQLMV